MKILHLLRSLDDQRALATAQAQADVGHQVTLLLLHDAVLANPAFPGPVFAVADDVTARGGRSRHQTIDYDAMVRLIVEHDQVISW